MRVSFRKLGWWARRRRKEADLGEELAFHMAEEAADRKAAGLTEEQARSAARRDIGNVTLVVEDTRAVWGWVLLEQAGQDLRYAARTLARSPSFTIAAVITLALGIGLTTAIFSIVHGVLLRPLPFDEPDRLLALETLIEGGQSDGGLSPPNFMSLQEHGTTAFAALAAVLEIEVTLTGAGEARRVAAGTVSAELFDVLQVRPVLGRTFHREENESGEERVVVLGHALWRQGFGADPGLIGRTIRLDGASHTVVGVMAPGFDFPRERAVWLPLRYGRNYFSAAGTAGRKNNAYVRVFGRLRPVATMEAARAELGALGRRLENRFPETNAEVSFTARPLHEVLVGNVRTPLLLLLGAVGFVLLIAGANVAGLLLARATTRREEIAVRGALGAGRGRIVRQLVTESLLLGLGGGGLGLLVAFWVTGRIAAQMDGLRRLSLVDPIRVDATVLAFAAGITIVASLLAGLLPAFRAADDGLAGALQAAGRGGLGSPRDGRLRSALVVGQLALAVVLLHGAGLLLHSFIRTTSVDPGFQTEKILAFRLDLPGADYRSSEQVRVFFNGLLEGIRQRPDMQSAGAISRLPIGQPGGFRSRFRLEGQGPGDQESSIGVRVVSSGYFQTIGVGVLRGRGITHEDRDGSVPAVVINEAAAARFFPGADPIGRRLLQFSYDPIENAADTFTIVGVVANIRSGGLRAEPQPEAYFAHAQVPLQQMFVVVRTAGDPLAHIGAIRSEIGARDRNLPVVESRTLDQVVADSLDRPRFFTMLVMLFSAVALALAAVGIFGLLSFAVARRTREIGVRIALGASPTGLVGTIVRDAGVLVGIGLAIGLGGALALTRTLESELFDVSPADPLTLAGVIGLLAATALLASLVPAWRAATVDPLTALRAE